MFKEIDHTETTVELSIDLYMHPLQCRHCHWTTLHSSKFQIRVGTLN